MQRPGLDRPPISPYRAPVLAGVVVLMEALAAAPPNIVVIVADDQGYADVGYHPAHSTEVNTPNIDDPALSGVVCTAGYASGLNAGALIAMLFLSRVGATRRFRMR